MIYNGCLYIRQGKICEFLGDSSYCWAFSIASMLRHSLNVNFEERKKENSKNEIDKNNKAKTYIQSPTFHKQLRKGFKAMKSI